MLSKRILSTVVLVFLTILVIFSDWLSGLVVTLLIIMGLYEFFTMLEKKGISIYKYFGIGMGAIIPLSVLSRFELTKSWELLLIVLALLFLIIMQFKRRESSGTVVGISTTIFGILYVSWFLSFLIKIRFLDNGTAFLAGVIIITKLTDIGAFLVGMRFGKTPLIPRISPKKSVEGAVGGVIFSVLGALICKSFLPFSYMHLLILGVLLSVLGQLGDLSESLIKRDCQIKDSGSAIPGIGGVLDLLDSLIFTAPAFYFYMSIVSK
ncbi:MAG: phosphatidate cytidylyltransferase [Candidatus Omnitrophota bacterium]|nr:phosphatidate cytidylyltransferase [Candidatus Omnitrophota bacterium]MBU1929607.1 phosphatidate cytidylyltransferase [Candidatus Omnitrophota bacterium]MBU2034800.1 phosphatidate cytidylyltransferase [Candidatus Omnitrophota bacterium]MBU2258543.1 phosphatidate cytidylyltransferase [Candidatus Omnitrophota bacterium]